MFYPICPKARKKNWNRDRLKKLEHFFRRQIPRSHNTVRNTLADIHRRPTEDPYHGMCAGERPTPLSRRGLTNKNEVEAVIAPGATLVLSILTIMSSLGIATKYALDNDEYVKQYRLQEKFFDSSSMLAPSMRGLLGTDTKIVDLISSRCRTVR